MPMTSTDYYGVYTHAFGTSGMLYDSHAVPNLETHQYRKKKNP